MARKSAGLIKRGDFYHIDKIIYGERICRSTKEKTLKKAEEYLAQIIKEKRDAKIYGIRPERTFNEAIEKYLKEKDKSSLKNDEIQLKMLAPIIGKEFLKNIHMGTLQKFIKKRQKEKVKNATINHGLQVVRHIMNIAAGEWIDENGLTWLESPPRIKLLPPDKNKRKPYPLSREEEHELFEKLPNHLRDMAMFKVNTGTREQEVCNLRWEWEVKVPELNTSIFVIPEEFVKNRSDRVVVLNDVAKQVVDSRRGINRKYVFSYKGKKLSKMNNTAWRNAREKSELPSLRVHDLKHTYGRRLRAVGVSSEDRQDLLGHKNGSITTHYSSAQIENLIEASNKIVIRADIEEHELFIIR